MNKLLKPDEVSRILADEVNKAMKGLTPDEQVELANMVSEWFFNSPPNRPT